MSSSRSQFYVETPIGHDPPSQRHSMYVSPSEVESSIHKQDLSSASSSATLPSVAGSVDRLTGLGNEKKTPRFFTLKPKTSFSLRPFFSSSSIASLSPSKRRRKPGGPETAPRRDSYVQTDDNERVYDDVGVQTLNASTVDVPVQTCSSEWDEGDTCNYRKSLAIKPTFSRFPYGGYSNRWSPSAASKPPGLVSDDSGGSKNSFVAPLDSSKLLKYAAPPDSADSFSKPASSEILGEVKSSDPVPHVECLQSSKAVPFKPFSVKDSATSSVCPESLSSVSSKSVTSISPSVPVYDPLFCDRKLKEISPTEIKKSATSGVIAVSENSNSDASEIIKSDSDTKINLFRPSDSPTSVLKSDRTDSPKPSTKTKSVHFQLSDSDSDAKTNPDLSKTENVPETDLNKLRNIDKEFEALLRNLDILTDEPSDTDISILPSSVPELTSKPSYISPGLKSALDVLKLDFLAPIPENDLNSDESPERNSLEYITNTNETASSVNETPKEKDLKINITTDTTEEKSKSIVTPTCAQDEDGNKLSDIKEGCDSTSFTTSTSAKLDLDVETAGKSENVYDKENTEEPVKTVFLPTLPSFFEPSSECINLISNEIVGTHLESPVDISADSLNQNKEDMLSRSSSRSSIRSNPRSDFEACLERTSKFDSCENLDQLEEEIIRSLYSPNEDNWETNTLLQPFTPPVQNVDDSDSNDATIVRRAILDRLLSGESVEEIMPSSTTTVDTEGQFVNPTDIRKRIKRGKKYVATLSKFEEPRLETFPNLHLTHQSNNQFYPNEFPKFSPVDNSLGKSSVVLYPVKDEVESPKECFLFPDINPQIPGITSNSEKSIPTNEVTNINNSSFSTNIRDISKPDEASTKCDFTNCLRPSDLQNSSFLAKISSKSTSWPEECSTRFPVSSNKMSSDVPKTSDAKLPNRNGQCDFANCLKPSEVQNSVFTAELSEITANKSSNFIHDSFRTSSPLTSHTSTPLPLKSDHREPNIATRTERNFSDEENFEEAPQHRSEITIVLQTSKREAPNENAVKEPSDIEKKSPDLCMPTEERLPSSDHNFEVQSEEQSSNTVLISNTIPPPPPPPPPVLIPKKNMSTWKQTKALNSLESQVQDQQTNLVKTAAHAIDSKSHPKNPVVLELEKRFEKRSQSLPAEGCSPSLLYSKTGANLEPSDLDFTEDKRSEINYKPHENYSPPNRSPYKTESNGFGTEERIESPSLVNGRGSSRSGSAYSPNTVITNEPPPPGAVLVDKKITVEGDKVHTDKYYALPVKEVLKETTSTTKFIPAPPKYEGIGPTEDGIPIGLRNSVKKENMHNWYKTMFKSLHKADSSNDPQEYIIGYSSEPESSQKDKVFRKKSSTLDNRSSNNNISKVNNNFRPGYPPSAKSSIEVYNVRPRLIEDYEPGQSSVTDDEITTGSKRFLPPLNVPKPSYEFKNGYEHDSHFTKKIEQPDPPSVDQQKVWYKEIQLGGEIPQYGLGKPAPEKPYEPIIGPLPPPPLNYNGPSVPHQATRPSSLPSDYAVINENGTCQQMNGVYEVQMRQAIHTELHQRLSPSSSLSSPTRSILKSPCKSPDLKIPARALFDFKAESPKEIPLRKGDNVLILRQLDKNWYEGEKQGIIGIFPINYIEIVPPEHAYLPQSSFEGVGKVLYDFTAHTSAELTVKKHDIVSLLRRVDSNWYEAQLQNKKGIIPASYLQVLQEPLGRKTPLSSPNSYISSPGSRPTSREGILKTVNTSTPSSFSVLSPAVITNVRQTITEMTNGRSKLQNRGKKSSNLIEPVMYRALYSYSPQNSDELELAEGDTVYVVEMCDDGWYVGTSVRTGVFGIFPGNYVEKV